jgi:DNA polymerase III alpha subunit
MQVDNLGRQILSESDICSLYLSDPNKKITNALTDTAIFFDEILNLENIPELKEYIASDLTIEDYDRINQSNWHMPKEYVEMDIAKYVLDLCKEDYELQRVGDELIKFYERGLFPLLSYCKYLVDVMRKNNVVWGVGRGSSVSSYVLYLIGIHRINSLHYGLSIDEFLK